MRRAQQKLAEKDACRVCNKSEYNDNCMSDILLLKTNGEIEVFKISTRGVRRSGDQDRFSWWNWSFLK